MRNLRITKAGEGMRADAYVTRALKKFSRSSLKNLFKSSKVKVNDHEIKSGYRLRSGDVVTVDTGLLEAAAPIKELPVIYEDKDVIVINKPAGILTHSKGVINEEPTVASFIKPKISPALSGNRAGIVHRLDRGTSGVMLTAKTASAQAWLQKQFSERKVSKTYLAVVEGRLDPPEALIDAPIGRDPHKPQTFKVLLDGRPAQTEYHTLKTFKKGDKTFSLIRLSPHTGRTHQIRVHLKYIGRPVIGDHVYGDPGPVLMLHASELEVTLPSGVRKLFISPPSQKFKDFIDDK